MDENGNINYRNWGFYEPSTIRGNLGLQLMPGGEEKPITGGRAHPAMMNYNNNNNNNIGLFHHMPMNFGPFHHRVGGVSQFRDSWINPREKYFGGLSMNQHHLSSFSLLPETSSGQEMPMLHSNDSPIEDEGITQVDEIDIEKDVNGPLKKRPGSKSQKFPKSKKPKKATRAPRESMEIMINGSEMDISAIPIPICSCTGAPQQCYRWGSGGWQSACCTTGMNIYPLPMSTKRRGARIAGRKMSIGAFKKVLEKLASEGYDFSNPIDLKTHWAKHGTNKFVTIR